MQKRCYFLLISIVLLSCTTASRDKSSHPVETNESGILPDQAIALQFINAYTEWITQNPDSVDVWIIRSPLVTDQFKSAYKNLKDSALQAAPEIGLGFDPILDAQDYPDKGFEIIHRDSTSEFVTVRGIDWPEFLLVLKLANHENKWLVDGSGVINMPENRRADR